MKTEDLSPKDKVRALNAGQTKWTDIASPLTKIILQAKMKIPPAGSRLRPSVSLDPPPPFTDVWAAQATATIGSCPHLCVKHKKCSLTKHLRSGRHIYLNQENTLLWRVWSQQQNLRYSSLNLLFFRFKAITEYWNKCVVRPKFWSKSPKSYPSLKLWIELLILILDIKYNRYELFQFCHCAASQNVPVVEFSNVVAVNVKDSE